MSFCRLDFLIRDRKVCSYLNKPSPFFIGSSYKPLHYLMMRCILVYYFSMAIFTYYNYFSFIIYFTVAISLFLFAIIFIIRYVALAILFIFSPLAFVLRIIPFPQAQKLWGDWWQKLIKWSFVGLSGAFFLRLATDVMRGLQKFVPNLSEHIE